MIRIITLLFLYTFNIIIAYVHFKSKKTIASSSQVLVTDQPKNNKKEISTFNNSFELNSKKSNVSSVNQNRVLKIVNSQTKNQQTYFTLNLNPSKELIKPLVTFVKK